MTYAADCFEVNEWSQRNPANMMDMIMMVALSIRQPWSGIGNQVADYREHGVESRFVWGNKLKTLEHLEEHGNAIYYAAKGEYTDGRLMELFIEIPGIGLAKAGFIVQLWNGRVGCIDSHNLKRLSIPASVLVWNSKAKPLTKAMKINAYIDACKRRRSEWLWNTWCNLIAKKHPKHFADSAQVSRSHVTYLTGGV